MSVFEDVKERVSIKDVLQHFGLQCNRYGNILCPFHADRNPSCKIYEETNSFYCFSCGAGGDVITFAAKYLNVSNYESAKYLAGVFGITDKPITLREHMARKKREREQEEQRLKEVRETQAFKTLTGYLAFLRSQTDSSDGWGKWQERESIIEYYLECLENDAEEFFNVYCTELEKIEKELAGHTAPVKKIACF